MGLCLKFLDWVKVFESLDSSLRYYAFYWLRLLNEVILIVKRWIRRQFTLDEVKKQPGKDVNKSEHDLKDSETNRSIDRLFMATNWSSKANTIESSLSSSWVRFRAQFRSLLRIRFVTSAKKCFFAKIWLGTEKPSLGPFVPISSVLLRFSSDPKSTQPI